MPLKTYVYVDGFNLHYGAVKGTVYKWLDLKALCTRVLQPRNQILKIKYFTAMVQAPFWDPRKTIRQETYIRALEHHIPELETYYGYFLSHTVQAPLANPGLHDPKFVDVIKTEEKGSDVSLGAHLVNDAWLDVYDCAVVVSNDSDLAEAISLVKQNHPKKLIGVLTPKRLRTSQELKKNADFVRFIRQSALQHSQLPSPIPGTNIRKPQGW